MDNNKKKLHNALKQIVRFTSTNLNLKIKSNYQLFPIYNNKRGRKIDFIGRCYATGFTTIRKRRALALMRQSRTLNKLQKKLPLCFHICASFMSRSAVFLHTNSFAMKVKYLYSINVKQLKDVIRKETYVENS